MRFTNAHSAAATSTPSRYAMLTGEYAWRKAGTGIADGDAGSIIRPDRYTMPDMFKQAGYTTAVVGKWHLGLGDKGGEQDWNKPLKPGTNDIGFDYSFIMAASWAKLIKKDLYNGLQYPDGKIFEDIYMSHHLINKCKKIVFTNEVMYYYYQWPESILGK